MTYLAFYYHLLALECIARHLGDKCSTAMCLCLPHFKKSTLFGSSQSPKLLLNSSAVLCICYFMSLVMRKPVYAICEQQRRRSTCASALFD